MSFFLREFLFLIYSAFVCVFFSLSFFLFSFFVHARLLIRAWVIMRSGFTFVVLYFIHLLICFIILIKKKNTNSFCFFLFIFFSVGEKPRPYESFLCSGLCCGHWRRGANSRLCSFPSLCFRVVSFRAVFFAFLYCPGHAFVHVFVALVTGLNIHLIVPVTFYVVLVSDTLAASVHFVHVISLSACLSRAPSWIFRFLSFA